MKSYYLFVCFSIILGRLVSVSLLSGICCRVMHGNAYPTEDPECYKIFEKNESEQLAFGDYQLYDIGCCKAMCVGKDLL